jgi:hypothetical protein
MNVLFEAERVDKPKDALLPAELETVLMSEVAFGTFAIWG